jgi:Holliday junction resolvasome RuvABC endonuclease subunit
MILGLDCATKTGWAITRNGGTILESGVMDFSKRRGESNGAMFLRFRKWLSDLFETQKGFPEGAITFVAYEQAHHRGGAATEIGVNLTGRVQEQCADLGLEYVAIHTATLKKWATGSGKADKTQMMARATTFLGRPPEDDNEADAVLIAMWAHENYAAAN